MGRSPRHARTRRCRMRARGVLVLRRGGSLLLRGGSSLRVVVRRVPGGAAVPVGLLLTSELVWQTSYAAFTATTSNSGNAFQTGTVSFNTNEPGTALFTTSDKLRPGATADHVRCIRVRYTGNIAATVKVYGSTVSAGTGTSSAEATSLADAIRIKAESTDDAVWTAGTACPSGTYTTHYDTSTSTGTGTAGSLTRFASHNAWSNGLATGWAPTATTNVNRIFRFTVGLADTSDNALQGKIVTTSFVWEAQNS